MGGEGEEERVDGGGDGFKPALAIGDSPEKAT